jgi:hypothetical protein
METKQAHPIFRIFIEPRLTIREIISGNVNQTLLPLSFLYGLNAILQFFMRGDFSRIGTFKIILLSIVFAPIVGFGMFCLWSAIMYMTGKLLKGHASFAEHRAAYAWSFIPYTVNVVFLLTMLILVRSNLAIDGSQTLDFTHTFEELLLLASFLTFLATKIWSWVIYINALSEVQEFSVIKAILNVAFSAGLLFLTLYSLIFIATFLTH